MSQLTEETFITHVDYIRDDIKEINFRLDALNGRTRKVENELAVIKDRNTDHRKQSRSSGMKAGALVGGIVTILTALIEHFIK